MNKGALLHNVWVRGGRARRSGPATEHDAWKRRPGLCALEGLSRRGFAQCHAVQHHNPRHVYPRGDEGTYARETGLAWASVDPMPDAAHTGSAMAPEPVVRVGSLGLVGGGDYTLPYANNVSPGTATVAVTGKGDFCGTKSATFTIMRAGDFPDAPPREASSSNLLLY